VDYRNSKLIGKGALGSTYYAEKLDTGEKIIVKELNTNTKHFQRIANSVILASKLTHPNLPKIENIHFDSNSLLIEMQYIDGDALDNVISKGYISLKEFFRISQDVLRAVCYLHENGLVHRDIKPANILIERETQSAFLIDYDLIQSIEAGDDERNEFAGTPLFMAPEQIKSSNYSTKSDIYSLGIILHAMLTGNLPYKVEKFTDLARKFDSNIVVLDDLANPIRNNLETLITRMISIDPDVRPTCKEVYEILNEMTSSINLYDEPITKKKVDTIDNELFASDLLTMTALLNGTIDIPIKTYEKTEISPLQDTNNEIGLFYLEMLKMEYNQLTNQASETFRLWKISFAIGLAIVVISIILIILGKPAEALYTFLLEGLIIFTERLFKIRENNFRTDLEKKREHLEKGDIWRLINSNINGIKDQESRDKKLSDLIDSLRQSL
jgi:serine/threonine protein kinase